VDDGSVCCKVTVSLQYLFILSFGVFFGVVSWRCFKTCGTNMMALGIYLYRRGIRSYSCNIF
jgi:hypothetical protein